MTDKADVGASVEATVGAIITGISNKSAMALALSIVFPPPRPIIKSFPFSLAIATTRSISFIEASPLKAIRSSISPYWLR